MYDHIKNNYITEAQIFYTRKCSTDCGACNLNKTGKDLKELTVSEWEYVFSCLQESGIRTIKLMGGEPTETNMPKLLESLDYLKNYTDIKVALLSNSKWNKNLWFDKLCASGLYGYYASVDVIKGKSYSEGSLNKSQLGYNTLIELKKDGRIPLLAANVVISKNNLDSVFDLVSNLSKENFYINLCSFQCGGSATYKDIPVEYNYRKEAKNKSPDQLLQAKKEGVNIAIPESYLEKMLIYGLYGGTWKCDTFTQVRIDCDGTVMICNEFRGQQNTLPNILEMGNFDCSDLEWERKLIKYWYRERSKYKCQCYWSCFLQALENIKTNKLEFGFVK